MLLRGRDRAAARRLDGRDRGGRRLAAAYFIFFLRGLGVVAPDGEHDPRQVPQQPEAAGRLRVRRRREAASVSRGLDGATGISNINDSSTALGCCSAKNVTL